MERDAVQSLIRTFRILETLAAYPKGIGLVELSGLVELHKSTVHRLLGTLSALGYVGRDDATGYYRLTYKLLELSGGLMNHMELLPRARPHLDRMSEKVSEAVHLVVPEGPLVVYLYKAEITSRTMIMRSKVGLRIPMIYTAVGKAILASWEEDRVREIWERSEHAPATGRAVTSFEALRLQLLEARGRGFAVDDEENEAGVRCVGVSICDGAGRPAAAISISAPAERMDGRRMETLAGELVSCRDAIRREMGWS